MTDPSFNASITALSDCIVACDFCTVSCLKESNVNELRECILANIDCSDVCRATLSLLVRSSKSVVGLSRYCGEICARCAEHCEMFDYDHCVACAKACRRAQEECEAIAA